MRKHDGEGDARMRKPGQQSPYFSDASMSIKAELVFLDARMRKHDGEG